MLLYHVSHVIGNISKWRQNEYTNPTHSSSEWPRKIVVSCEMEYIKLEYGWVQSKNFWTDIDLELT